MRIRLFSIVFLLSALAAAGAPVRVLHYDAIFDSGDYAALCVVPEVVKENGARFVCYYALPGRGKVRDNTDGSAALQQVGISDPNFSVWLNNRLPAGGCVLSVIPTDPELPTPELMNLTCPGVAYEEGTLPLTRRETFIADVHKAVEATLAKPPAPPAPVVRPVPAVLPAVVPARTQTAEKPPHDVPPPENTTAGATIRDDPPPPPPSPDPSSVARPVTPSFDWTTTGLLVLITVLVVALVLERLSQLLRRNRLVKNAWADDEVVRKAGSLQDAAVILHEQRNDARLRLEGVKRTLAGLEGSLGDVDRMLGITNGSDRIARLSALQKSQKALLHLGGADTPEGAVAALQEKLKERAQIDMLLGGNANVLEYVRECRQLVTACENAFWSHAKSPSGVRTTALDIAGAVQQAHAVLGTGGSESLSAVTMLADIKQALRKLPEQQRLLDDQGRTLGAVCNFITSEWPDVGGDMAAAVPILTLRMREARAAAERVQVSERNGDELVTALAALVERERNASRDAQEILRRIREYLALPDRDAEQLNTVIAAENGTPQRVLRLVIAAALPVARQTLALLPAADLRVADMLGVPAVLDQLDAFLGRLWTYDGHQLWNIGIESAFAQNWLHHLFRAEAVLRTYFHSSHLADLGDALAAIAWGFRHATNVSGYEVDRVQLLADVPEQMDRAYESAREFRVCPDIRSRVLDVLRTKDVDGFAVDVNSVGVRGGGKVLKRGALVIANRHDWEG